MSGNNDALKKSELFSVFTDLDDIFHKLEMYVKGENLGEPFVLSTDGSEVRK